MSNYTPCLLPRILKKELMTEAVWGHLKFWPFNVQWIQVSRRIDWRCNWIAAIPAITAIHVPRFGDHFQSLHHRLWGRPVVFAAASFFPAWGTCWGISPTPKALLGLGTASMTGGSGCSVLSWMGRQICSVPKSLWGAISASWTCCVRVKPA